MSEKEKYLDMIQTINGKESWKAGVKTCVEDEVFRKNPNKAWALITDDPANLALFSIPFLLDNRCMVDYVYNRTFDRAKEGKTEKNLQYIPYQILRGYYTDIQKKVSENGSLLALVPYELQNEFVQIPYEAVKNDPLAIQYAATEALLKYPDISVYALRKNWHCYYRIPIEVRCRYDFRNMIR